MDKTISCTILMEEVPCGCGVTFMVPDYFVQKRRADCKDFWCPACGSRLVYKETETDKLKRRVSSAEERAKSWMAAYDQERAAHEVTENRRRAAAGQITKLRKRVGNGVCPCCNRTFQNLRRHMATKHPEMAADAPHP